MNEEFVFISSEGLPDRLGQAVRGLIQGCQLRGVMHIEAPFSTETASPRSFVKFLQGHIQQARNKGFDDSVSSSRHPPQHPPYFEVKQHFILFRDMQLKLLLFINFATINKIRMIIHTLCLEM